jgi:outer membrane protein assembly factor BamE (lipoprotein component of BamABCDE complex)
MNKLIVTLVSVALLAGCATAGNERMKDQSQASIQEQIVEGKSTKSQVQNVLGSATSVSFTDGGSEVWTFKWSRATPQARNFIPVVSAFSRGIDVKTKELVVMFDKSGVVQRYTMRESNDVVNRGLIH